MNHAYLIYHSPKHGKGMYINSVKLLLVLSIFHGGPHGRIAERLDVYIPSENIVNK